MAEQNVNQLVGHLFRHESGKMAAVLTRIVGLQNLDLAQDLVQDTLLKAINTWKIKGIPENPSAWLYTVAKRKALDAIRQRKIHAEIESDLAKAFQSEWTLAPAVKHLFFDHEIEDSQLRMMFACCHPSIPYESQIALTLKTLCGLSISEIAHSFLTNDETITKRLYRAREKIREEKIDLEIPSPRTLVSRLETVQHTIYLLFTEGYNSSHPDHLIRHDLCEEAMRLCLLLTKKSLTDLPSVRALMALMCFQASRFDARLDNAGNIILLQFQDRARWNKPLIEKGNEYINSSAAGEEFSEYHLEAAIAACHANAPTFECTNWKRILVLYELLSSIKSDPIVELNKAIALGLAESPQKGLEKLTTIKGLENNSIYHAAMGNFFQRLKKTSQAKREYQLALELTKSKSEIELLQNKITSLDFSTL
jgi:RNA polymerase sigma-70 factor (ECF subfamily)